MNTLFLYIEMVNELKPLGAIWSLGVMAFVFGMCWLIVWDRKGRWE